jgi:phytoene dehydrogenase-like protein
MRSDGALYAGYLAQKDQLRQELESPPLTPGGQLTAMAQGPDGQEHLRFHFQSVRSWASEQFEFESDAMRDLIADFAGHAGFAPDDAGGVAFSFLFLSVIQDTGNRVVKGGMGQLPAALAACLRHHGGEVRAGVAVARIMVEEGAAAGVVLENGEQIRAKCVASNAHPSHLTQRLLKYAGLDHEIVEAIND